MTHYRRALDVAGVRASDRLRDQVLATGMTLEEIAQAAQCSRGHVRKWIARHVDLCPAHQEYLGSWLAVASNAKADLAPASGAQVQRLVSQTEKHEG